MDSSRTSTLPKTQSVRLDDAMLQRVDAVARALSLRTLGVRVSRSEALRIILARGLEVVEYECHVVAVQRTAPTTGGM